MDRKAYTVVFSFVCLPLGFLMGCGGSGSVSSAPPVTPYSQVVAIKATSGSSQSAASGKTFNGPFTATVTVGGAKMTGEKVTFTAPASGASGTFANGTTTESDITNDLGVAVSSAFTANTVGGTYTVTATVSGAPSPVSFSVTNIPVTAYSFYMSGQDQGFGYYALAGSVVVDATGNVFGGEQDYNDGGFGFNSPEPKGDQITGGTLTFASGAPPGQATLTLNTNNPNLGLNANGVEVFGVQFVNPSHALITQFDGFATSSGSLDLQTLPSTLSGSYAFAISGFESSDAPVSYGGVFSISGGTLSNGIVDINDSFNSGLTTGTAFTGTVSAADSYGRGTIKGLKVAGTPVTLNYYIVGPEVIRLIDVDVKTDSALGSAFGQGSGTFGNASIGPSVLAVAGNVLDQFGALGQFTTSNTSSSPADFSGVGDDSEPVNGVITSQSSKITGTYSIASNGYGNLAFNTTSGNYPGLGDVTTLGIYMTDPALNLNDPNNPIGGGGALVVDLDAGEVAGVPLPGGTGFIIPQTDAATATTDFAGNYAVGWQNFDNEGCGCEFDMIAQGTMVANGALSLTGLVSDPFLSMGTPDATSSSDTFEGTPLADSRNPGRYTMLSGKDSLATLIDGATGPKFDMVIYQASGGQLFWLDYDSSETTVSLGPLEQQESLTGLQAARKPVAKSQSKRRQ
ncbi:MAG: hypothetical protein WBW38_13785 [Candidatus Sulfotelmatobacter sp.]